MKFNVRLRKGQRFVYSSPQTNALFKKSLDDAGTMNRRDTEINSLFIFLHNPVFDYLRSKRSPDYCPLIFKVKFAN
jgi:hypothetical protein